MLSLYVFLTLVKCESTGLADGSEEFQNLKLTLIEVCTSARDFPHNTVLALADKFHFAKSQRSISSIVTVVCIQY